MTGYNFVSPLTTQAVNWDDPGIWSGGIVPNAADADVAFPTLISTSTGAPYISTITIKASETFTVRSIDLHDTIAVAGTLNAAGAVSGDQNGHLAINGGTVNASSLSNLLNSSAGGIAVMLTSGVLTAGSITNSGIGGSGTVTVSAFSDASGITGYASLTVNADSFSETGQILSLGGTLTINVKAGGFAGLAGGVLSGANLATSGGALAINAGSLITVDNGAIGLNLGTITSRDATTGQDVALTSSLQTIGAAGTLTIDQGSYQFGNLFVSGKILIDGGNYSTSVQPTIALNANNLTIDTSGVVRGGGLIKANIVNNGVIVGEPTAQTFDLIGNLPANNLFKISGTLTGSGHLEVSAPRTIPTGIAFYPTVFSGGIELTGATSQNAVFDGNAGTLKLDDPYSFAGSIAPNAMHGTLGSGDTVILQGVSLSANPHVAYAGDKNGGTLTIQGSTGPISLHILGNYTAADFQFTSGQQNTSTDPASLVITIQEHSHTKDLLWSQTTGYTFWSASTSGAITPTGVISSAGLNVIPIAQADFNGDGNPDILFQNSLSQSLNVSLYQNGYYAPSSGLAGMGGGGWSIVGVADFNGDGKADLLWRNGNATGIWQSNGNAFLTGNYYDTSVPADWHVVGTGDFNNDGRADIVWRNANGALSIWSSTGADFDRNFYQTNVSRDWHIEGVGDFNGDGKADLLWRNDNGAMTIWSATNGGFNLNFYGTTAVGNDWQIAKVSDINGDGVADILWHNSNGALAEWLSTGNGFTTSILPYGVTGWQLTSTPADFV